MRKLHQIRLRNLEILIAQAGSAARLARACDTNSSYLSQVRHQTPNEKGTPRTLGNRMAEKLEKAMGKPSGWMDTPHADGEEENGHANVQKGPEVQGFFPLISWVQAGHWHDVPRDLTLAEDTPRYPCPVLSSPDTFVLRVRGTSMEPKFQEGDLIYVDPNVSADHGKYVVVQLDDSDEATFKQLIIEGGKKYLKALNPDWPDRIIEVNVKATICGVIIYQGKEV